MTGAPGGLFVQYGGVRDVVLVGTRDGVGANALHGLSLADGSDLPGSPYTAGGTIGAISGAPAVDYAAQRVYFASRSLASGPTLWCVQVAASPLFAPCSGWTDRDLGDIDRSPVLAQRAGLRRQHGRDGLLGRRGHRVRRAELRDPQRAMSRASCSRTAGTTT